MHLYYVNDNAQSSGEHEVHTTGCVWLEKINSKTSLGLHLHNFRTLLNMPRAVVSSTIRTPDSVP